MWAAGARHGWALPTLAYKLNRHTQSDYLDCHIYLEKGDIHHSSAAGSTRPTLIPSVGGGESSLFQNCIRLCLLSHSFDMGSKPTCLKFPRKKMQALPSGSPLKLHGRGRIYADQKAECSQQTCLCPSLPLAETAYGMSPPCPQ